jgi:hypothetical protein
VPGKSASTLAALQRDFAMPNQADDCDIAPVVSAGPTAVSDLVGWQPDLLRLTEPRRAREMPAGMTDDEVLAHYRDSRQNPYLNLRTAKALRDLDLKYRHVKAAVERARETARQDADRHLRELVNREK